MLLFLGQGIFYWCLVRSPDVSEKVNAILVYSGAEDRLGTGVRHIKNGEASLLVTSGWEWDEGTLQKQVPHGMGSWIMAETKARTTDENARYLRPMLKEAGFKAVALVLPWYHLPRACFLTRLYLLGTGIRVVPVADPAAPPDWWRRSVIWVEGFKLWGSLARAGLACIGIENWPRPQFIPTIPSK